MITKSKWLQALRQMGKGEQVRAGGSTILWVSHHQLGVGLFLGLADLERLSFLGLAERDLDLERDRETLRARLDTDRERERERERLVLRTGVLDRRTGVLDLRTGLLEADLLLRFEYDGDRRLRSLLRLRDRFRLPLERERDLDRERDLLRRPPPLLLKR